jgi:hypothetical protein
MRAILIGMTAAAAALAGAAGPAAAAAGDPAATARAFIEAFDKGDAKTAKATHAAAGVTIIDEVPPYLWSGATAFDAWNAALGANDKAGGIDSEKVSLGALVRQEVTGSHAYLVFEATYSFKQHGVAMSEPARMTFAERRTAGAWKIVGWTWTGPKATPAS